MNIVCICKMHFCFVAATTFGFVFVALGATRNTGAATITAFPIPPSFTSPQGYYQNDVRATGMAPNRLCEAPAGGIKARIPDPGPFFWPADAHLGVFCYTGGPKALSKPCVVACRLL